MININNLSFGYRKGQEVLKNISLTLPEGHVYGLLGQNGVGKSTLLKLLSGALLGKGEYTISGLDPRKRQPELQEQVRLVPENEAIFHNTIYELAKVTAPLYPNFRQDLLEQALQEFEVPATQKLTTMSLGQQKKALISLSLACGCPNLFMDEPTNGMDIPSKSSFRRIVASIADEKQSIIISTHQVDDLEGLIDYVIIMSNSGVLLADSLDNIGRRFTFGQIDPDHLEDVIYYEPSLRGAVGVCYNKTGEDMPVDVKLLFTAVVKNPKAFQNV